MKTTKEKFKSNLDYIKYNPKTNNLSFIYANKSRVTNKPIYLYGLCGGLNE